MSGNLLPRLRTHATVVARPDPDVGCRLRACERFHWNSSVFEGFVRSLKQEPLLRIHRRSFPRRDSEKRAIELPDILEERAVARGRPGSRIGIRVDCVRIPAVFGHFADRVAALAQQLPEFLEAIRTRETARRADDGDRFHWFLSSGKAKLGRK